MADKRRMMRVQGGWAGASGAQLKSELSQSTGYSFFCGCNHAGKELHKDGNEQKFPPVMRPVTFKPCPKPVEPPSEMTLTKSGRHILSITANGVSSVTIVPDFIEETEQEWMFDLLKNEIPWEQKNIIIKGDSVPQPRLTCWYGDIEYSYSGLSLKPLQFSPLLEVLRTKLKDNHNLQFNSMLANLYRNGKDSVDWHADDEKSLGKNPMIASISLGATRTFELRQIPEEGSDFTYSQHVKIPLASGTLLIMDGAVQGDWQHRVPKEYHDRDARINLTFRTIFPNI